MKRAIAVALLLAAGSAFGQEERFVDPSTLVDIYVWIDRVDVPSVDQPARGVRDPRPVQPLTAIVVGPYDRYSADQVGYQIVRFGLRHETFLYPPSRVKLVEFRSHE